MGSNLAVHGAEESNRHFLDQYQNNPLQNSKPNTPTASSRANSPLKLAHQPFGKIPQRIKMLRFLFLHSKKNPKPLPTSSSSSSISTDTNPSCSLTIHFLKNSCFLSPSTAISASQKLHLKNTKNPHAVLSLLKSYNFGPTDISKLVSRHPNLLLSDPDKTLKPKLDFFASIGFSGPALPSLICSVPKLLQFSLDRRLIVNFNLLKTLLKSESNALSAIKCSATLLVCNLDRTLFPKLKVLEDFGVPTNVILKVLMTQSKSLMDHHHRFDEIFETVKRVGINPKSPLFAHALGVLGKLPERAWVRKVENFKGLGWTEDQVIVAFSKHPYCMTASIEKIEKNMEFFRERFGWSPEYVSRSPVVLSFSYEKRVLPRSRVFRVLKEKGFYEGRIGARQLMMGDKEFLKRYVLKYCEQVPEIIDDRIRGKIEHFGLIIGGSEENILAVNS